MDSVPWVSFWRESQSEISTAAAAAAAAAELGVDSFTTQQQRVEAKRVTGVRVFIHTQLLSCLFPHPTPSVRACHFGPPKNVYFRRRRNKKKKKKIHCCCDLCLTSRRRRRRRPMFVAKDLSVCNTATCACIKTLGSVLSTGLLLCLIVVK